MVFITLATTLTTMPFACTHEGCSVSFPTKPGLRQHMEVHDISRTIYTCPEPACKGKTFMKKQSYDIHMKKHDPAFVPKFVCKEEGCGKGYDRQRDLDIHMRSHTNDRPFKCTEKGCQAAFTSQICLIRHMVQHEEERETFTCPHEGCGKTFSKKQSMDEHMRNHTGQRDYVCELCGEAFMTSTVLNRHMWSHDNAKNFVCPEVGCGKTYKYSSGLLGHKYIHTGVKPYTCRKGCDKCFATTCGRISHERLHTNERPYTCKAEGCGAAFRQQSQLTSHMRTHTTEYCAYKRKKQRAIQELLEHNHIHHKIEHRVEFSCLGRTHAYVDFLILGKGCVIMLEVDEDQHCGYGVNCEVRRMTDIASCLHIEGNTLPVVFIRYNPDSFTMAGEGQRVSSSIRQMELIQVIRAIMETKKELSPLTIGYMYYDSDEYGMPFILDEPEYDNTIKECVVNVFDFF